MKYRKQKLIIIEGKIKSGYETSEILFLALTGLMILSQMLLQQMIFHQLLILQDKPIIIVSSIIPTSQVTFAKPPFPIILMAL